MSPAPPRGSARLTPAGIKSGLAPADTICYTKGMKKTLAVIATAIALAGCSGSSDPVQETVTHTVTADHDPGQYRAMSRAWAATPDHDKDVMCRGWNRDPAFVKDILNELDDSTIEKFYNDHC